MQKKEIMTWIPQAFRRFSDKMPGFDEINEVPVTVVWRKDRTKQRADVIERCGAEPKEDLLTTVSEVIAGINGKEILVYQNLIQSKSDLEHSLWHELGHVYHNKMNEKLCELAYTDVVAERDTPLRSGFAVWNEFIAEAISFYVEDAEPDNIAFYAQDRLKHFLRLAFSNGYVTPYWISFYAAHLLTNPTLEALTESILNADIGWDNLSDGIIKCIDDILCVLADQMNEEQFWVISFDRVMELGKRFDELWTESKYFTWRE